ncbi:MAG TPA: hypothetical protein VKX17_28200 [Planctomycetota bacterium]|nr:hypothetical protein [Planctomycetota bacterium]
MHKTKENLAKPSKSHDQNIRDAYETANEEDYEAIGGETSTEGVGRGYDAEGPDASPTEKAESTADGPISGELADSPSELPAKRNRAQKGVQRADTKSNHAAVNNTKSI